MPSKTPQTNEELVEDLIESMKQHRDTEGLMKRKEYRRHVERWAGSHAIESYGSSSVTIKEPEKTLQRITKNRGFLLYTFGEDYDGVTSYFVDIDGEKGVPILIGVDTSLLEGEDHNEGFYIVGTKAEIAEKRIMTDGGVDKPDCDDEERIAEAVTQPDRDRTPDVINAAGVSDDNPDASEAGLGDFMGGDSPFASDDSPDPTPDMNNNGGGAIVGLPTGAIPLGQIEHERQHDRKRILRRGGKTWPSTNALRNKLSDEIMKAMSSGSEYIIEAPTGLGKSYTVASTRWGARDDVTGGNQVVHTHKTRNARDEAIEVSEKDGGEYFVLRSRDELCPIAAGEHDPENADGTTTQTLTVDGMPASEYIDMVTNQRSVQFSEAHKWVRKYNDQNVELPCEHDGACPAIKQWEQLREGDYPLVHCTQQFLHTPRLRRNKHVLIDEEPDFTTDLSTGEKTQTERVRDIVEAYLKEVNAMVSTWEEFWSICTSDRQKHRLAEVKFGSKNPEWEAKKEGYGPQTYKKSLWEDFEAQLKRDPQEDWYRTNPNAHTAAGAMARALLDMEETTTGRRAGQAVYTPHRIDDRGDDDRMPNRNHLQIVFDGENKCTKVRTVPSFYHSESLIGLDAHPAPVIWQNNTCAPIKKKKLMTDRERSLWRRNEKGVEVIQLGDATRPLTSSEYYNDSITRTMVEQLRDWYGDDFNTAITSNAVESDLLRVMQSAGILDPQTMHYGEEKSRNDFEDEDVGFILGAIDPGDDMVMDELAIAGLNAEPEMTEIPCPNCSDDDHDHGEGGVGCANCMKTGFVREKGRNFVGEDAAEAEQILASVRENHVCQSIGRWGRNPDDPEDSAKVFVATDAMPDYMVDVKVPGAITTYEGHQEEIVEVLRNSAEPMRTQEIAREVGCTARNVRSFLNEQAEIGRVEKSPREGKNGATLYAETGLLESGALEVEEDVLRKQPVQGYNDTWCFRTAEPTALVDDFGTGEDSNEEVTADDDAESSGLSGPLDS